MAVKVKIELNKVLVDREKLHEELSKSLKKFVKEEAPVYRRGSLKNEINMVADKDAGYVGYSSDTFWSYFVEYGHAVKRTRKGPALGYVSPNPFVSRAVKKFKKEIPFLVKMLGGIRIVRS